MAVVLHASSSSLWTRVCGDVDLLLSKNRSLNLGSSNGNFCYCDANNLRFAAKTLAKKISATILHMSGVFAARPLRPRGALPALNRDDASNKAVFQHQ